MSNSLAVATVSGAVFTRVRALLNAAGLTAMTVKIGHPKSDPDPGVYITLYQVTPNLALRNLDLPTRRPDGSIAERPVLPLNLRYLFSFLGDEAQYDCERLAGLVLSDLHARPIITPEEMEAYVAALAAGHYLKGTDLPRQSERIRLSPLNLDAEELSRVWGLFNQSLYALSMAWEATSVLLDGQIAPSPALPVATTNLVTIPAVVPTLTKAYQAETRLPVVALGDELVLEGTGLLGERTRVFIGEGNREVDASVLQGNALRFPVASITGLRPGVHSVFLDHRVAVPGATGDGLRPSATSNALAVMVRPTLGAISVGAPAGSTRLVQVAVTPLPLAEQQAELVLERSDGARRSSRTFTINGGNLAFTVRDLGAGTWFVRLSIDGSPNQPSMSAGVYSGPTLVVP